MLGFVITGHGAFATGLESALSMVAGELPHVRVVTFENSEAASYPSRLEEAIAAEAAETAGVLVFVDLMGGTPFNQAMMISTRVPGVSVVCGTNLPMLIETLFARNADDALTASDAVALAITAGTSAVVSPSFGAEEPADAEDDPFGDEDGI